MGQSSGEIIALAVAFTILPAVTIGLRTWARKSIQLSLPVDEWLLYISWITMTGLTTIPLILMCIYANLGNPSHRTLTGDFIQPSALFNICARIIEAGSHLPLALAKASILLFFKRIFYGLLPPAIVWGLLVTVIAWCIAFFFAELFSCVPVAKAFTLPLPSPEVYCINPIATFQASAASNIALEVIIMVIPGPLVAKLRMPVRWKIAVTGIFLLAAMTLAASIVKIYYFVHVGYYGGGDTTNKVAPPLYWTMIECGLSITAVCLPCLGPIFHVVDRKRIRRRIKNILSYPSEEDQNKECHHGVSEIRADSVQAHDGREQSVV